MECIQQMQAAFIQGLLYVALLTGLFTSQALGAQTFVVEPQNQSVIQGSLTILKCTVSNRVGPLQWTRDKFGLGTDRSLPGFPRYSMTGSLRLGEYNLLITDAQIEDDANFECQVGATDAVNGIRSRTAKLTVLLPPERPFIDDAPTIAVVLNTATNITCHANGGKPAADISWHRDGVQVTSNVHSWEIPQADQKRVDTVSTLTIVPVKSDSGKRVECQATNEPLSEPYKTEAILDVQFPPEVTMVLNISRTLKEYDNVRFTCDGISNPDTITWKWYRNDVAITDQTRNVYDIAMLSRTFHGDTISCEATNSVGGTKKDYKLEIEYGPKFTDSAVNVDRVAVDLYDEAVLMCEADGNPTPSIIWTKKGNFRPLSSSPTLRIAAVGEGNFGIYVCTATVLNFNDVSQEIYLLQNGPPKIMSDAKQFSERGNTALVDCIAMSVPEPDEIIWTRDGKLIDYATSGRFSVIQKNLKYGRQSTLQILGIHSEDFGNYNCTVINQYGEDNAMIALIEKDVWLEMLANQSRDRQNDNVSLTSANDPVVLPLPYIIGGTVGGIAVLFFIILACVLYHRYKSSDTVSSGTGTDVNSNATMSESYIDSDSSSIEKKKDDKSDSTEYKSTLMDQWRQDYNKEFYRYSADYDELNYQGKDFKGNNNGYGFVTDPYSVDFRDEQYAKGVEDEVDLADRYESSYSTGYVPQTFRGDYNDTYRLPGADLSTAKLATNV